MGLVREAQLLDALAAAAVLVMTVDEHGVVRSFDNAAEQATGLPAVRIVGRSVADFLQRESEVEHLGRVIASVLESGEPSGLIEHWTTPSRGVRVLSWTASLGAMAAGRGREVTLIGRDVTDQEQTKALVSGMGIGPKIIFDQVPAVIWAVDRNLQITLSVGAALEPLGYANGQLVGSSLFAYLQTESENHPSIVEHRRAIAGETVRTELRQGELAMESVIQPLRAAEGEIIGAIGIAIDVSAKVRAVETTRRQQAELNTILDAAPAFIWYKDRKNRIIRINAPAARVLGMSVEEVQGRSTYELYPDFAAKYHRDDLNVIESGVPKLGIVEPHSGTSGEIRWVRTDKIPYRDASGEIVGVIVFSQDITDQKRAEEALERLADQERVARLEAERVSRIKDEFLITLSHELRTPLMPILGWTELLVSDALDAKASASALKAIERNAKLELQLIEDLLDTSRIISGTLRLDMARVELAPVIAAAVETVRLAAEAKGITVQVEGLDDVPAVIGDTKRLRQVFWNLLANAVKFTPQGTIKVRRVNPDATLPGMISLSIEDTGIGMAPDFLPHAFDRFRQADATTSRVYGGLGLGLALVRHIVEAHGGQVDAASAGEGLGSVFTVTLPIAPGARASQDDRPGSDAFDGPTRPAGSDLDGLRVLVVEDTVDDRDILVSMLEQQNFETRAAGTAADALKVLGDWRPHMVVSDIGLPEIDGYQLIKEIRARGEGECGSVPAIAVTAYASAEDRQKAIAAGFQEHLPKPVTTKALLAAITTLVKAKPEVASRPV
jgi:PAS domain S-box-containing protein